MNKFANRHYLVEIQEHGDERGCLGVLEENADIPFKIKRIFYIYNTDVNTTRGNHANIDSRFGFISLVGSCCIEVDDGCLKKEYVLDSPTKLLLVDKMVWKVMKNFSEDNILLVLSDQVYNSKEYINDYEKLKLLVQKGVK
jgi:WxcM-like, C-terminal.